MVEKTAIAEKQLGEDLKPPSRIAKKVVYNQINWNCLSKKSKSYFNDKVKIFSGLFGLVNPNTLIPNYKLKMNSLSLAKFWLPILSKHLENEESSSKMQKFLQ